MALLNNNGSLSEYLKLGVLKLVDPEKGSKSKIYEDGVFKKISEEGKILPNNLACSLCLKVYAYKKTQGTGNLLRHKEMCQKKFRKIEVSQFAEGHSTKIKKEISEDLIRFVAQDIRPLSAIAGRGFINLENKLIQIGASHGNIAASSILPVPTTVSKGVKNLAEQKRNELQLYFEKFFDEAAITLDVWTDDYWG